MCQFISIFNTRPFKKTFDWNFHKEIRFPYNFKINLKQEEKRIVKNLVKTFASCKYFRKYIFQTWISNIILWVLNKPFLKVLCSLKNKFFKHHFDI